MEPVERIEVANELGENALWDAVAGAFWWTDIEGRALYRLTGLGGIERFPTPARLASFGLLAGHDGLIAAFEDGVALFDPQRGAVGPRLAPDGLARGHRLNDGRVDRGGRFWVGSMVEDDAMPSEGRLYRVGGGRIDSHLDGIGIGNGLCWSPDDTVCYFADSRAGTIWHYDFDAEHGRLRNRREFARSQVGACPDGAAVDAEGFVWSAQWGGGCVVRYAPDGRRDRVIEMPVSRPTCVAFGGPGLDLLFVTTARSGLCRPETGAGDLFVYNVGVHGLPESRFRIDGWAGTSEFGD